MLRPPSESWWSWRARSRRGTPRRGWAGGGRCPPRGRRRRPGPGRRRAAAASRSGAAMEHRRVAGSVAGSARPSDPSTSAARCMVEHVDGVQLDHVGADPRLQLVGRALGDHAASVDDDDGRRQVIGLVEILRRQHDVGPGPAHLTDAVPHLVAAPRIEPRGRLVEEQDAGRADEARPEVEPPAHARRNRSGPGGRRPPPDPSARGSARRSAWPHPQAARTDGPP